MNVKFYHLLLILFVGINTAGLVYAQDIYIGAHGGVSLPRLKSGSDVEITKDYKSRTAPNFGAFLELGISKNASFQTEVNYAGHGGKRNGVQPIPLALPGLPALPSGVYYYGDFNNTAILNYLEVPALFKYKFGSSRRRNHFFVNAGAFYGRLLNAKTITAGSSMIYVDKNKSPLLVPPLNQPLPAMSFNATTNTEKDINKNNFGLAGGGGIEFPTGKNYFFIEARVTYGLTHIQKDALKNGSSHTGNLLISFGYAFRLKK